MVSFKKGLDNQIDYLDLVEEYKDESSISLFEKVLIMSNRARDLYAGKTSRLGTNLDNAKPTAIAQYELLKGMIEPEVKEIEEQTEDYLDDIIYE